MRKLNILEPSTRESGPILICDEAHNDVAEFFHNEHATVSQSYETALEYARCLVVRSEAFECLQGIADMKGDDPRELDDADWRYRALEAERAAQRAIAALSNPTDASNASAEARLREALGNARQTMRNSWGAVSTGQIFDKDVEWQLKQGIEAADKALSAGGGEAKKSEGLLTGELAKDVSAASKRVAEWKSSDPTADVVAARAARCNASAEARLRVKTSDGFEVETLQSGRITKIISGPYSAGGGEAKKSEGLLTGELAKDVSAASKRVAEWKSSDPSADVTDITRVIYETLPSFNWDECSKAGQAVFDAFTVWRR